MSNGSQGKSAKVLRYQEHDRNIRIDRSHLDAAKRAMVEQIAITPQHAHIATKIRKCSRRRPCNIKYCAVCSNRRTSRAKRYADPANTAVPGICQKVDTKRNARSSNFQMAAGQRMVKPFDGLPNVLLHPVTVNLAIVPLNADLASLADAARKELYRSMNSLGPDVIMRGKLDIVLKWADKLSNGFPDTHLPPDLHGGVPPPHERVAMLHAHFVVYHPKLSRGEIRDILIAAFPGTSRVCVRTAKEAIRYHDGFVTMGIQGYLEYSSLEKVEVKFGDESTTALIEYIALDSTWGRANRNLRYGNGVGGVPSIVSPTPYGPIALGDNSMGSDAASGSGIDTGRNVVPANIDVIYDTNFGFYVCGMVHWRSTETDAGLNWNDRTGMASYTFVHNVMLPVWEFDFGCGHHLCDLNMFTFVMNHASYSLCNSLCNSSADFSVQPAENSTNFPMAAIQTSGTTGRGQSP